MPIDSMKKLEDAGFVWNIPDDAYEARISHLMEYEATNGHCSIPIILYTNISRKNLDGNPFPGSVGTQRWEFNKFTEWIPLSFNPNRMKHLEDFGFVGRTRSSTLSTDEIETYQWLFHCYHYRYEENPE